MRDTSIPRQHHDDFADVRKLIVRIISEVGAGWWTVQPQKGDPDNPSDANLPTIDAYWPDGTTEPVIGAMMLAEKLHPSEKWELSARACENVTEV